jgi:electron transport complex protein RnfC
VQYFRYAKAESWAQEQERRESEHAKQRHDFRVSRLERLEAQRKARLRKKKEDLKSKPPSTKKAQGTKEPATQDAKQAAIEAAMKRAAEKKAKQQHMPKNTDNLTPAQQAKIEAVDKRRAVTQEQTPGQEQNQEHPE